MKTSIFNFFKQRYKYILLFLLIAVFYLYFGCPAKLITGVSCPGCGMTRALISLISLDFHKAIEYHPLVILMPLMIPVVLFSKRIPQKLFKLIISVFLILLLIVYIIRMSQQGDIVSADFNSSLIYRLFNDVF